jgi:hypothetical protein
MTLKEEILHNSGLIQESLFLTLLRLVKELKKENVDYYNDGSIATAIKKIHPDWDISDIMVYVRELRKNKKE